MPPVFAYTLRGTEQIRRTLRQLGANAPMALARALYPEAEAIATKAKTFVPVDLGALRESIHVAPPVVNAREVSFEIGAGGPAAPYAIYIHEGSGPAVGHAPFFPPIEALKPWFQRHGIPPEAYFVVAKAIGLSGLQPTKFFERAFNEQQAGMPDRVAIALRNAWLAIGPAGPLPAGSSIPWEGEARGAA